MGYILCATLTLKSGTNATLSRPDMPESALTTSPPSEYERAPDGQRSTMAMAWDSTAQPNGADTAPETLYEQAKSTGAA